MKSNQSTLTVASFGSGFAVKPRDTNVARQNSAAWKRMLWLAVLMLAVALIGGVSIYLNSTRGADGKPPSQKVQSPGQTILAWGGSAIFGVMVMTLGFGSGMVFWGALRMRHSEGQLKNILNKRQDELETERTSLHGQLNESRKLYEHAYRENQETQTRFVTLAHTNEQLQEELNKLRQAEKNLAQQRRSLEQSKGVLELHVQERTQELQKLQRRSESILNAAGEGICGLDVEERVIFANPAVSKITGWTIEEILGREELKILRNPDGQVDAAKNEAFAADRIFLRKDETTFQAEYTRTNIYEGERVVGAVVIFKDITERKLSESRLSQKAAELARSNAELEQFAFVASHDLQEPLRKIQAFGERLKTKCSAVDLGDGLDYLERMQNAAARMQRLINDLLTFSRAIRSSQPFVPVDLNGTVKEAMADLEFRIEQSKAMLEIEPLPTLDADPTQMRQLLQNLLCNALKFQPPNAKPVVKVRGKIVNQLCEITVQDNGIGFDEQYAERIFAVFQRLHGRNEYEGTGVGLAVCRRITDRHGGIISARSKVGEGATFTVTLPVKQTQTT